jgi:hypothetical protein
MGDGKLPMRILEPDVATETWIEGNTGSVLIR